jgi:hypothetical protein
MLAATSLEVSARAFAFAAVSLAAATASFLASAAISFCLCFCSASVSVSVSGAVTVTFRFVSVTFPTGTFGLRCPELGGCLYDNRLSKRETLPPPFSLSRELPDTLRTSEPD